MQRTLIFNNTNNTKILNTSCICGPKEAMGPIGNYFKNKIYDDTFGEKTYEKAECKMHSFVINDILKKSNLQCNDIDALISGDLLNQIISASFSSRNFNIPFIGVYNACSTISEALALSAIILDCGHMKKVICSTSSHFSTAERQYRYPLELGSTRPPQSQWTVTGAGAFLLGYSSEKLPYISMATFGKIVDFGIKDVNNMGCAMAPSAMFTLITHFKNTKTQPTNYDAIITGDLGVLGSKILKDLMREKGFNISDRHFDCGEIIYNYDKNEYQGGSGAGCSSIVMSAYFYDKIKKGEYNKVIFIATGALLSTISSQQGESIPGIAHLVVIER